MSSPWSDEFFGAGGTQDNPPCPDPNAPQQRAEERIDAETFRAAVDAQMAIQTEPAPGKL